MKIRKSMAVTLTAAALASVAVVAVPAAIHSMAYGAIFTTRYTNANACQVVSGTPQYSDGQIQDAGSGNLVLHCPIITDTTGSSADATPVVDGWCTTAVPFCLIQECLAHVNGGAESCGNQNPAPNVGVFHVTPDHPTAGQDYPYLKVTLTPGSALFGYRHVTP
jgi:hypothetical protein